jgi:GR25 family glycosyltransferase involved in LPS biosynthesis/glycosyltransferase involved in cell wall biosynthesis
MSVSLICACKNRIDALRISLNSWIKFEEIIEIIICDWNSDEPIDSLLDIDPRIKIIRVNDQEYFNQPQPLNIAADLATGEYILKVDCDYIINPYYNFFDTYHPGDNSFVCGEYANCVDEGDYGPDFNYASLDPWQFKNYEKSYSPFYKYLIGLLYIKRENFLKINGYNESLCIYYAFEDDEIFKRLENAGLEKIKIDFDNTLIHIPHPDAKRFENFQGHLENKNIRDTIYGNLEGTYFGEELDWQVDYVLATQHIQENKRERGEIVETFIPRICSWDLSKEKERYYTATPTDMSNESKLKGFPTVNYISLEESKIRQQNLKSQFNEYGIDSLNPLISKRFDECNDVVSGPCVDILDSGTKGCVVSHIKMIKNWIDQNNGEKYGFFCEDDLSLESVNYWDFTWKDFIENLPEDAECVQLYCIRDYQRPVKFEERSTSDWSVTAYILTREYAQKIVDQYYVSENEYNLTVFDTGCYPMPENVIFYGHGKVYAVNIFLEDTQLQTTFGSVDSGVKENHIESYNYNFNWWKENQQNSLNLIFKDFNANKTMKNEVKKPIENDERYEKIVLDIEELLTEYSQDTENAELNFKIGLWYEYHDQDAAALSFFLRGAERADDDNLAYECLIHGAYSYDRQGTRDMTSKGIFQQALCLLPKRPEAYYHLSNFCRKRSLWQECYIYASTALNFAEFEDNVILKTDIHYPGKYAIIYEKALAAWDWGKIKESYDLLEYIEQNYDIPEDFSKQIDEFRENFKKDEWFFTDEYKNILKSLPCNKDSDKKVPELKNDIGKIDVVLAGHYDDATDAIIDSYLKHDFVNNVIVSTWEGQGMYGYDSDRVRFIRISKPETPGTDNRNLQIATAHAGLELVTTNYCAKMRTDQEYDHDSMITMYTYMVENREFDDQIFVAGIYPNLLFHPRDHIFWGRTCDVRELYNVPLEHNGLADKIKVTKENLYKYYPFFVRNETYIGARYCSKFDETINLMILEPEKYLHDNCGGWSQAHQTSQNVTYRAFKAFPRTGVNLKWSRKGLDNYPYDDQKMGYGECWAEDFAQV